MSRFFIVNTVASPRDADGTEDLTGAPLEGQCTGCAWLFRAEARIDDPEAALRGAVTAYFGSPRGRGIIEGERLSSLRWEDAIPWVPDEVWEEHGLAILGHPEVERLLVDAGEDLLEELRVER